MSPKRRRTSSVALLRYLETFTESAQQLHLQVYIRLRQWSFPTLTRTSSLESIIIPAFGMDYSDTGERTSKSWRNRFQLKCSQFKFLTWHISTFTWRYVVNFMIGHCFLLFTVKFQLAKLEKYSLHHFLQHILLCFTMCIERGSFHSDIIQARWSWRIFSSL